MTAARVLHAALQLLDRQLVDREGLQCGKVDDLELSEPDEQGHVYVHAILSGPGALLGRTGHDRLGSWLRRAARQVIPIDRDDPVAIPMRYVADIGDHIALSLQASETASSGTERWVRDHVIGHIPGSGIDADG
jgi:sporulation protein YlmC with PRC-barrel domain